MAFRTGNPALNGKTFGGLAARSGESMTLSGTVNKTAFLLMLVIGAAYCSWREAETFLPLLIPLALGGFALAMVVVFKKTAAPYLAPAYALVEGLFLGAVSTYYEMRFPGIVVQAIGLTFGVLFTLLAAYRSGWIKPTEKFKLGVAATTGAIGLYYLLSFGLSFAGITMPFLHDSGPLSIAFSVFVVLLAAANLVLDFDFVETGVAMQAPKFMEWYAAFGLVVTLVWLYLEILRLLSKLSSRR